MNARDERIIIFGDSLTHEFADSSAEIWDVDQGSSRGSSSPGSLLASLLLEQGASAVRTDSRVGRSAVNFFSRENAQGLLASDTAFAPTKVVVMLGTNDIGMGIEPTRQSMQAIRDAYQGMGAEVWAIGPMTYVGAGAMLNNDSQGIVDVMQDVFGARFIDARPLSINVGRSGDGVHFGGDAARMTALNLAQALLETKGPMSPWTTGALIAIGVIGAVAVWGVYNRKKRGQSLLGDGALEDLEDLENLEEPPSFHELIRDEDPAAMQVAEDLLLEKGWKMSEIVGGTKHGTIELKPMHGPKHEWKMVQWHVYETDFPGHVDIKMDIANGTQRIERKQTVQGSMNYARKAATADSWAIAKAIKTLPLNATKQVLETTIDRALDKDNSEPSELYGATTPKKKRRKQLAASSTPEDGYRVAYGLVTRRDGKIVTVRAIVDAPRALTLAEAERWRRQRTETAWVETMDGKHVPVKGAKRPGKFFDDARPGDVHATLTTPR
jgi:lysophospholipase L1-like esterase